MGRGRGSSPGVNRGSSIRNNQVKTIDSFVLDTNDLSEKLKSLSSSPNVLAYGALYYSKAFDVEFTTSGGLLGHCSCPPDDFCRCERIEEYEINGFSSDLLAEEVYKTTLQQINNQTGDMKWVYEKTKAGKAAAEQGLTEEEKILYYAYTKEVKNNHKPHPLGDFRRFSPSPVPRSSDYSYGGNEGQEDYDLLDDHSNQRIIEPTLIFRLTEGKTTDLDKKALQELFSAKGLTEEDLEPTKTSGIYGEESGPVYIEKEKWEDINQSYEDYLNNTVANDIDSVNAWLTTNIGRTV